MPTTRVSKGMTIALAAVVLAGAAGCGSKDDGGSSGSAATPAPSTPASTTADAPVMTTDGAPQPKTDAVATTPPGEFALGDKAVLAHQEFIDSKFVDAPLQISVTKIEQGSLDDLKNFKLDAQSKQGTPFYISAEYKNLGDITYDATGMAGGLTVLNDAGDESTRLGLIGDFPKCEATPPKSFKPGATAKSCDVFILPKGQKVSQVYAIDTAAQKYIWKAG